MDHRTGTSESQFNDEKNSNWYNDVHYVSKCKSTRKGTNSSVQIDVDPINPRGIPECRFLGPDHGGDIISLGADLTIDTLCPSCKSG